ncbi:MAG: hypothetical protein DRI65_16035, partial [Chloroflexota bacterium]
VAIYSPSPDISVTVKHAVLCDDNNGGDGPDAVVTTTFSLESYSPAAGAIFHPIVPVAGTSAACGGSLDIIIKRDISANPGIKDIGGTTWYRAKLRASMDTKFHVGNSFEIVANTPGALISYYSQSGNDFVLQDRGTYVDGTPRLTDYHLGFGTECDFDPRPKPLGGNPVELEWFDDDLRWNPATSAWEGIQRNVLFKYRMELIERTRAGVETARYHLNRDGTDNFIDTSGWAGDGGSGWATFNAKLDHTYEWIWHGVSKSNAIQFQQPFDSIYYLHPCDGGWAYSLSPLSGDPAASSDTRPGGEPIMYVEQGQEFTISSTVTHSGTDTGDDYYHIMRPTSEWSNENMRNTLTKVGFNDPGGDAWGGFSNKSMGYKVNPSGLSSGSSTEDAKYTVNDDAGPGTAMCWLGRLTPINPAGDDFNSPPAERICVEIIAKQLSWDYSIDGTIPGGTVGPTGQAEERKTVKRGDTFSIASLIKNNGDGEGKEYYQTIRPKDPAHDALVASHLTLTDPLNRINGTWYEWSDALKPGLPAVGDDSRTRTGEYEVGNSAPDGTDICFYTRVNPAKGNSDTLAVSLSDRDDGDICVTVEGGDEWNYVPKIPAYPADEKKYAGTTVSITSTVLNDVALNEGTGLEFDHKIETMWGDEYLTMLPAWDGTDPNAASKDAGWDDETGLAPKKTIERTAKWTINEDAKHGAEVCFRSSVNPSEGNGSSVTKNLKATTWECFDIFNLRYDLDEPTVSLPTSAAPGEKVTATYSTCNDDNELGVIDTDKAVRGGVSNVSVTSSGDFDGAGIPAGTTRSFASAGANACKTVPEEVIVPPSASVGDVLCTTVEFDANHGFSANGAIAAISLDGGPVTRGECITVGVQPYFHVQNADVWAGANFDTSATPSLDVESTCPPGVDPNINAGIRTVFDKAGSLTQYGAMAVGDIEAFGSQALFSTATLSTLLTFANDEYPPKIGRLSSETRCIPNYFGLMYGEGEELMTSQPVITAAVYLDGTQYWKEGPNAKVIFKAKDIDYTKNLT